MLSYTQALLGKTIESKAAWKKIYFDPASSNAGVAIERISVFGK